MTTPIKVAMLIHGYHPLVGGAERQLAAFAPRLQKRGVEVHVITRRPPELSVPSFELIDNIPVHRLSSHKIRPLASLLFTLNAMPLLRRLKPDIVHAHTFISPTTTAIISSMMFGFPVVLTSHRSGPPGDVQRFRERRFAEFRTQLLKKYTDAFITISKEIDQELESMMGVPPERRFAIPNGVDTERFKPLLPEEKQALRASLNLPSGPIAIYAGRLVPEKRVNHLISIWNEVRAAHPDALLLILGTGEEEAALKQQAGEGVRFEGRIENVTPYLQAVDLFILPSVAEGLSVALLEALACNLPIIITNVGGASDVIEHGVNGWLIPPDDVTALRDAVLKLLGDSALRTEMGRSGRERVLQYYELNVISDQLRQLYDQVLAQESK